MPERVRTVFGDDGKSFVLPKASPKHDNAALNPSKKRKRDRDEKPAATTAARPTHDPTKHAPKPPHTQASAFKKHAQSRGPPGGRQQRDGAGREDRRSLGPLAQKRQQLLPVRKGLPIWAHQDEIRAALRADKDVLILVGETGSGKSTQVPQFLLAEPWLDGSMIAITQPRRVAAISLARRVAEEMGTPLGASSPASRVGYSVRFDVSVSPSTKVKFLTEGMLLQELLRDPWLKAYGSVVVDEVHERSVNVDLVLGFLRRIVCGDWKKHRNGRRLKVIVMSATADTKRLLTFFDEGYNEAEGKPVATPNGKTNGVNGTEDSSTSKDGKKKNKDKKDRIPQTSSKGASTTSNESEAEIKHHDSISTCFIEGRMYPVKVNYLPAPTQDFVEAALKTIFQVHHKEPLPGDILVFLTGQDTVEALEKLVNEYAAGLGPELPKILTLPLFAALPQNLQQRVFQPAPPRTRKVILSTNIAETSVTVPGVRHVIDSGKSKIKQFRPQLNLDSLLVKPISQSAAIQRKGRSGREAAGDCYRLYTEKDYLTLQKDTTPEILRCDLSAALLTMKARGVQDVLNFPFLDPPPRESLEKALLLLFQLGALTDTGDISPVGLQIAKLPLTPTLGCCIVEAAKEERSCVEEVIDIVAALSVENVFLNVITEEKREEAELARRELFRREGDHLTLLATVQAYAAEHADRKAWCERRFVSHRAMQNVMDIRKQLRALCASLGLLVPAAAPAQQTALPEAVASNVLLALLRGFAPNTARLMPDGSYRTMVGNQTVTVHPSSVLFGKKVEAIVFSEFVFTNRSYARGVSAVRLDWVVEGLSGLAA
ncbi:putative atp-dependent rna helicase protein [Neofusicoccum parvum UCRNP2]|uniref:RNA helicase n=1 Tax=Botryosphaeria parva (strain UCR-NP2) TaxID=1287680 RepID=R1FZ58_BOTPV|nr:putative atp-dependent rna helicase protein [Neofusicoccum parvum UCRNP2]